jgi:hypothetical protein
LETLFEKKERIEERFQILTEKYSKLVRNIGFKDVNIRHSQPHFDEDSSQEEIPQKKKQTHSSSISSSSNEISLKQLPNKKAKKIIREESEEEFEQKSPELSSEDPQEQLTLGKELETSFFSKPPVERVPIEKFNSPKSVVSPRKKENRVESLLKKWENPTKKKPLPKPVFLLSQSSDKGLSKKLLDDEEEEDLINNSKKEIDLKRKKSDSKQIETPNKKQKKLKEKKSKFEPNSLTVVYEDIKKEKPNLIYGKEASYDLTGDEPITEVVAKRTIPPPQVKSNKSSFTIASRKPEPKEKEKETEKGQICEKCKEFYEAVYSNKEEREKVIQLCSRHRHVHSPPRTPPGYWEFDKFTQTQTQKNDTNPSLTF